jgi:two-component system cell cycle response regulator
VTARILVVDDNRTNRDLMLYLLRAFGYEAEGAVDGLSGLEAARRGRFDLVLLDMLMPGIDGYEFARRFKADASAGATPLVAVTALAMAGDRERILEAGLDGYIAKPIEPESFVDRVELYLGYPLRSGTRRPSAAVTECPASRVANGPMILAVDDVAENLEFMRAALTPFGFRVVDAGSVDEAIVLLERAHPAIIICDIHMPRRDGFELLNYVRGRSKMLTEVPFVFLSSTGWEERERRRGFEAGAAKFLRRPIEPERLRAEIEALVRG